MSRRRPKTTTKPAPLSPATWGLPLVLIATALVFAPALNFRFVFDDRYQIAQNPTITSWSYLPQYFRSHVWGYSSTWTNYYRPVFLVALRIWESFAGLDPLAWHAYPIAIHVVNVALVFLLTKKLSNDDATGLIAAALFAVHPIHIEAVAAVFGVTDALMASSLLASLLFYLQWKKDGRKLWFALSALLFASGLLTKESAVVFPLVLLAYESIVQPSEKRSQQTRSWTFAIAVVLILVAYFAGRHAALGTALGLTVVPVPWSTVVLTIPLSLVTFLRLLLIPYGMSSFYNCTYVTRPDLIHFFLPLALLLLVAFGVWFWSRRTRTPLIAFAGVWALLSLLPVLNIRLMQEGDFIHIRFLYVPCIPVSLLAAIALRQLVSSPRFRFAAAAALTIALAISTYAQIGFLADNVAMFQHGVAIAPHNRVPANNLADEYIKAGRLDDATALLDENLRRHPDFWMSNYNRGYIAYLRKNWPEVDDYMNRSIANHGEQVDAYVYRGFALLKLGRTQEAEQSVRQAIALNPQGRGYHFVLGLILRQEQRWSDALGAFQQELVINPNDAGAATHIADLRTRIGK